MDQPTSIRKRAQALRKNATKEENHLWYDFLKTYPVQFRRQVPFGPYIVDFYCEKAALAIELDGSQHYETQGIEHDRQRTEYLEKTHGLSILRFSNLDVNRNFGGVCREIDSQITRRAPSSAPAVSRKGPLGVSGT